MLPLVDLQNVLLHWCGHRCSCSSEFMRPLYAPVAAFRSRSISHYFPQRLSECRLSQAYAHIVRELPVTQIHQIQHHKASGEHRGCCALGTSLTLKYGVLFFYPCVAPPERQVTLSKLKTRRVFFFPIMPASAFDPFLMWDCAQRHFWVGWSLYYCV